jgi:hypothetical protein
MCVCVEEVRASHHVLTELQRLGNRHGLGERTSFELDRVSVGPQPFALTAAILHNRQLGNPGRRLTTYDH